MAAELVESTDTPQTCAHDLESFFWVLLWIVMTQVKTKTAEGRLSSIFHDIMNCSPGSVVKGDFLGPKRLAAHVFDVPSNVYLRRLLESLQTTLYNASVGRELEKLIMESGVTDSKSDAKESGDREPPQISLEFKELYENLSGHFSEALAGTDWPGDDRADPQNIPPPSDATRDKLCGSKRAWDASLTNTTRPSSGPSSKRLRY